MEREKHSKRIMLRGKQECKNGGVQMHDIEFEIIKNGSHGFIVIRKGGEYSQHSHHKTRANCRTLIHLIHNRLLPRSKYLQGSCRRLLTEEEYGQLKEKKQHYININKGVVRK